MGVFDAEFDAELASALKIRLVPIIITELVNGQLYFPILTDKQTDRERNVYILAYRTENVEFSTQLAAP